jgi:glycine/D-amino acid oxidase-like deaminating enzyme
MRAVICGGGVIGACETTAIVHPRKFTEAIMSAAQRHGAELRRSVVTRVVRRDTGSAVQGVEVDGGIIHADAVVIAMGPWTILAGQWLPLPGVYGQLSPSLVFNTGRNSASICARSH